MMNETQFPVTSWLLPLVSIRLFLFFLHQPSNHSFDLANELEETIIIIIIITHTHFLHRDTNTLSTG